MHQQQLTLCAECTHSLNSDVLRKRTTKLHDGNLACSLSVLDTVVVASAPLFVYSWEKTSEHHFQDLRLLFINSHHERTFPPLPCTVLNAHSSISLATDITALRAGPGPHVIKGGSTPIGSAPAIVQFSRKRSRGSHTAHGKFSKLLRLL